MASLTNSAALASLMEKLAHHHAASAPAEGNTAERPLDSAWPPAPETDAREEEEANLLTLARALEYALLACLVVVPAALRHRTGASAGEGEVSTAAAPHRPCVRVESEEDFAALPELSALMWLRPPPVAAQEQPHPPAEQGASAGVDEAAVPASELAATACTRAPPPPVSIAPAAPSPAAGDRDEEEQSPVRGVDTPPNTPRERSHHASSNLSIPTPFDSPGSAEGFTLRRQQPQQQQQRGPPLPPALSPTPTRADAWGAKLSSDLPSTSPPTKTEELYYRYTHQPVAVSARAPPSPAILAMRRQQQLEQQQQQQQQQQPSSHTQPQTPTGERGRDRSSSVSPRGTSESGGPQAVAPVHRGGLMPPERSALFSPSGGAVTDTDTDTADPHTREGETLMASSVAGEGEAVGREGDGVHSAEVAGAAAARARAALDAVRLHGLRELNGRRLSYSSMARSSPFGTEEVAASPLPALAATPPRLRALTHSEQREATRAWPSLLHQRAWMSTQVRERTADARADNPHEATTTTATTTAPTLPAVVAMGGVGDAEVELGVGSVLARAKHVLYRAACTRATTSSASARGRTPVELPSLLRMRLQADVGDGSLDEGGGVRAGSEAVRPSAATAAVEGAVERLTAVCLQSTSVGGSEAVPPVLPAEVVLAHVESLLVGGAGQVWERPLMVGVLRRFPSDRTTHRRGLAARLLPASAVGVGGGHLWEAAAGAAVEPQRVEGSSEPPPSRPPTLGPGDGLLLLLEVTGWERGPAPGRGRRSGEARESMEAVTPNSSLSSLSLTDSPPPVTSSARARGHRSHSREEGDGGLDESTARDEVEESGESDVALWHRIVALSQFVHIAGTRREIERTSRYIAAGLQRQQQRAASAEYSVETNAAVAGGRAAEPMTLSQVDLTPPPSSYVCFCTPLTDAVDGVASRRRGADAHDGAEGGAGFHEEGTRRRPSRGSTHNSSSARARTHSPSDRHRTDAETLAHTPNRQVRAASTASTGRGGGGGAADTASPGPSPTHVFRSLLESPGLGLRSLIMAARGSSGAPPPPPPPSAASTATTTPNMTRRTRNAPPCAPAEEVAAWFCDRVLPLYSTIARADGSRAPLARVQHVPAEVYTTTLTADHGDPTADGDGARVYVSNSTHLPFSLAIPWTDAQLIPYLLARQLPLAGGGDAASPEAPPLSTTLLGSTLAASDSEAGEEAGEEAQGRPTESGGHARRVDSGEASLQDRRLRQRHRQGRGSPRSPSVVAALTRKVSFHSHTLSGDGEETAGEGEGESTPATPAAAAVSSHAHATPASAPSSPLRSILKSGERYQRAQRMRRWARATAVVPFTSLVQWRSLAARERMSDGGAAQTPPPHLFPLPAVSHHPRGEWGGPGDGVEPTPMTCADGLTISAETYLNIARAAAVDVAAEATALATIAMVAAEVQRSARLAAVSGRARELDKGAGLVGGEDEAATGTEAGDGWVRHVFRRVQRRRPREGGAPHSPCVEAVEEEVRARARRRDPHGPSHNLTLCSSSSSSSTDTDDSEEEEESSLELPPADDTTGAGLGRAQLHDWARAIARAAVHRAVTPMLGPDSVRARPERVALGVAVAAPANHGSPHGGVRLPVRFDALLSEVDGDVVALVHPAVDGTLHQLTRALAAETLRLLCEPLATFFASDAYTRAVEAAGRVHAAAVGLEGRRESGTAHDPAVEAATQTIQSAQHTFVSLCESLVRHYASCLLLPHVSFVAGSGTVEGARARLDSQRAPHAQGELGVAGEQLPTTAPRAHGRRPRRERCATLSEVLRTWRGSVDGQVGQDKTRGRSPADHGGDLRERHSIQYGFRPLGASRAWGSPLTEGTPARRVEGGGEHRGSAVAEPNTDVAGDDARSLFEVLAPAALYRRSTWDSASPTSVCAPLHPAEAPFAEDAPPTALLPRVHAEAGEGGEVGYGSGHWRGSWDSAGDALVLSTAYDTMFSIMTFSCRASVRPGAAFAASYGGWGSEEESPLVPRARARRVSLVTATVHSSPLSVELTPLSSLFPAGRLPALPVLPAAAEASQSGSRSDGDGDGEGGLVRSRSRLSLPTVDSVRESALTAPWAAAVKDLLFTRLLHHDILPRWADVAPHEEVQVYTGATLGAGGEENARSQEPHNEHGHGHAHPQESRDTRNEACTPVTSPPKDEADGCGGTTTLRAEHEALCRAVERARHQLTALVGVCAVMAEAYTEAPPSYTLPPVTPRHGAHTDSSGSGVGADLGEDGHGAGLPGEETGRGVPLAASAARAWWLASEALAELGGDHVGRVGGSHGGADSKLAQTLPPSRTRTETERERRGREKDELSDAFLGTRCATPLSFDTAYRPPRGFGTDGPLQGSCGPSQRFTPLHPPRAGSSKYDTLASLPSAATLSTATSSPRASPLARRARAAPAAVPAVAAAAAIPSHSGADDATPPMVVWSSPKGLLFRPLPRAGELDDTTSSCPSDSRGTVSPVDADLTAAGAGRHGRRRSPPADGPVIDGESAAETGGGGGGSGGEPEQGGRARTPGVDQATQTEREDEWQPPSPLPSRQNAVMHMGAVPAVPLATASPSSPSPPAHTHPSLSGPGCQRSPLLEQAEECAEETEEVIDEEEEEGGAYASWRARRSLVRDFSDEAEPRRDRRAPRGSQAAVTALADLQGRLQRSGEKTNSLTAQLREAHAHVHAQADELRTLRLQLADAVSALATAHTAARVDRKGSESHVDRPGSEGNEETTAGAAHTPEVSHPPDNLNTSVMTVPPPLPLPTTSTEEEALRQRLETVTSALASARFHADQWHRVLTAERERHAVELDQLRQQLVRERRGSSSSRGGSSSERAHASRSPSPEQAALLAFYEEQARGWEGRCRAAESAHADAHTTRAALVRLETESEAMARRLQHCRDSHEEDRIGWAEQLARARVGEEEAVARAELAHTAVVAREGARPGRLHAAVAVASVQTLQPRTVDTAVQVWESTGAVEVPLATAPHDAKESEVEKTPAVLEAARVSAWEGVLAETQARLTEAQARAEVLARQVVVAERRADAAERQAIAPATLANALVEAQAETERAITQQWQEREAALCAQHAAQVRQVRAESGSAFAAARAQIAREAAAAAGVRHVRLIEHLHLTQELHDRLVTDKMGLLAESVASVMRMCLEPRASHAATVGIVESSEAGARARPYTSRPSVVGLHRNEPRWPGAGGEVRPQTTATPFTRLDGQGRQGEDDRRTHRSAHLHGTSRKDRTSSTSTSSSSSSSSPPSGATPDLTSTRARGAHARTPVAGHDRSEDRQGKRRGDAREPQAHHHHHHPNHRHTRKRPSSTPEHMDTVEAHHGEGDGHHEDPLALLYEVDRQRRLVATLQERVRQLDTARREDAGTIALYKGMLDMQAELDPTPDRAAAAAAAAAAASISPYRTPVKAYGLEGSVAGQRGTGGDAPVSVETYRQRFAAIQSRLQKK